MMNHGLCSHSRSPNTNGTLEVSPPTAEDVEGAKLQVNEIFQPTVAVSGGNKRGSEVGL